MATAALTGCSGAPSESNIHDALVKLSVTRDATANASAKRFDDYQGKTGRGPAQKINVISARKIGCAEAKGASGYQCDVEVETSVEVYGVKRSATKDSGPVRFYKDQGEWFAAK